jgi:hypothetical protein
MPWKQCFGTSALEIVFWNQCLGTSALEIVRWPDEVGYSSAQNGPCFNHKPQIQTPPIPGCHSAQRYGESRWGRLRRGTRSFQDDL